MSGPDIPIRLMNAERYSMGYIESRTSNAASDHNNASLVGEVWTEQVADG
jgi:hypothetical protein